MESELMSPLLDMSVIEPHLSKAAISGIERVRENCLPLLRDTRATLSPMYIKRRSFRQYVMHMQISA